MKKLLAILLAAMMLLSLAACTNNDDNPSGSENNPGTSQSDNQGGEENKGGEENNGTQGGETPFTGYEWPVTDYLTAGMRWTGNGIVVKRSESSDTFTDTGVEYKKYTIYIETATFDEIGAYLTALKNEGFIYYSTYSDVNEPALEFDSSKMYKWDGEASDGRFVRITFYSDDVKRGGYDNETGREYTYALEILAYSASPMTEPNQYTGN